AARGLLPVRRGHQSGSRDPLQGHARRHPPHGGEHRGGLRVRHRVEYRVGVPAELRSRHVGGHLRDARKEGRRDGVLRERSAPLSPSALARGAPPPRPGVGRGAARSTGAHDPLVFPLGAWLRAVKLDELPQLINVLKGEMAIVGPRPEDPAIVARHYDALGRETLTVRPGLASPGSIYSSTHGDALLTGPDPEAAYAERLLPVKLALDVVYTRHASLAYDARIV